MPRVSEHYDCPVCFKGQYVVYVEFYEAEPAAGYLTPYTEVGETEWDGCEHEKEVNEEWKREKEQQVCDEAEYPEQEYEPDDEYDSGPDWEYDPP